MERNFLKEQCKVCGVIHDTLEVDYVPLHPLIGNGPCPACEPKLVTHAAVIVVDGAQSLSSAPTFDSMARTGEIIWLGKDMVTLIDPGLKGQRIIFIDKEAKTILLKKVSDTGTHILYKDK